LADARSVYSEEDNGLKGRWAHRLACVPSFPNPGYEKIVKK